MNNYKPCPRCHSASGLILCPGRRRWNADEVATFPAPPKRCPDCVPAPADAPPELCGLHVVRVP